MNYLMIIIGIALFFYGYSQNKKMKKNFRNLYEEALKNESEQNAPEEKIEKKKKIVDEKIIVASVISKEIKSIDIDIEKNNEENVIDSVEEKFIEKKIIEKQITEEEKKYNIVEKIKNAKDKKTFYKEIVDMLDQYEDDAFRDEIARETGINKGGIAIIKKYVQEIKLMLTPNLLMGIGIGIIIANFIFIAYQSSGYNDYEIEKRARKLGMKYQDEMLVNYK